MHADTSATEQFCTGIESAGSRWASDVCLLSDGVQEPRWRQWSRVNSLRNELRRAGARSVGVAVRDPLWLHAAALAAFAGHLTYVPLSPLLPQSRRCQLIRQAGADALILGREDLSLVDEQSEWRLLGRIASDCPLWIAVNEAATEPRSAAYVMFTSGSTGMPKGVPISYENLWSFLEWVQDIGLFGERDRIVQTFDVGFDLSLFGLLVPWLTGGSVVWPRLEDSVFCLPALVKDTGATVWFSVPTTAYVLLRAGLRELPGLRSLMFCGELLHSHVADPWRALSPAARLENLYGPTEATLFCMRHSVAPGSPLAHGGVPIGHVARGHEVKLIDSGATSSKYGELLVRGSQVFDGYLGSESGLGFSDGDWYRTGDLVREDAAGVFHFLGRADRQTKVNGYRIELAEIEHVLRLAPGVVWAEVFVREESNRLGKRLHARVLGDVRETELHTFVSHRLPAYMVPRIERVDELHRSASGKVQAGPHLPPAGA